MKAKDAPRYYVGPYTFDCRQKGRIEGLNNYIYANEQELIQDAREHGYRVTFDDGHGNERLVYDPEREGK